MANVLYITHDGLTDPLGQSQVIPYLSGLSAKGFQITIVSAEKPARYSAQKEKIAGLLQRAGIKWHPIAYGSALPIVSRFGNSKKLERKCAELFSKDDFSIIHCRGYIASLTGLKLKKRFGAKFIFDMRGFWADERIDGRIWSKSNPVTNSLYRYFKKKEIEFINNSDYVISLTENAKNEIITWKKVKTGVKIKIIPCCVDMDLFEGTFSEESKNTLRKALGIAAHDHVISYLGSIGTWYLLYEMLLFFKRFLSVKPDAKFLFITPDEREIILRSAGKQGIPKERIIITSSTRNDIPLHISLSHHSVYFIRPTYSKKASSPTKMAELLAMRVPIITNSGIGDTDTIVKESGCGILLDDLSERSMDEAISRMNTFAAKDRSHLRKTAEKYFSLEKGIAAYDAVYREMLK